MARSKEEIQKEIEERLAADARIGSAKITVKVDDKGTAILEGIAPKYTIKRTAGIDAFWIKGVKAVDNQISVTPIIEEALDSNLEMRVRDLLFWDADINSKEIDVKVFGGVVTINGNVDAYWKKIKASEIIQNLKGVIDVINTLAVIPTRSSEDKLISKTLADFIENNPASELKDIDVVVKEGLITLNGKVPFHTSRKLIEDFACNIPGVKDVINNLEVI